jgi:sec-independent protein translocase protein TatB
MSFSDTIFLFFLVLILFGPKKLPEIARQAGRLLAELRRASNEFRSQIENEINQLEVKKNETHRSTTSAPQGAIASLSLNPSVPESIPLTPEPPATLAAPAAETPTAASDVATPSDSAVSHDLAGDTVPAAQESHG